MGGLRKTLQILLSLLVLLAIVATASTIYPIPYVTDFVSEYIVGNQYAVYAMITLLALIAVYFAVALIWAMVAPAKSRTLTVKNDFGQVAVNRETVKSAVHREILDVKQAVNKDVQVKFGSQPEKTKVKVDFSVDQDQSVQSISDQVSQKAKEAAERVLATSIKDVKVSANTFDANNMQQQSSSNQSRVR